ncbi:heme oxygenase [Rhodopseudomonas julia]|uniref:Heme oxygenase n=1 Tax=Rhodopseudomonas julia TaxID=200617 RepID=A0ABU0C7T2_9BRAD|nr:biliverdin-producing heme oxygenase [Rhodopseudomonas julia]MDQ0326034.1 heme oxygenase [Rhodopseudomonas julia]
MRSVRALLHAATAELHAEVEARLNPMLVQGETGYASFLRANAAAIVPVEETLEVAGIAALLSDWDMRRRSSALLDDIEALGAERPQPVSSPDMQGEAFMLGAAYVLEGSRLGAKILTRDILADAGPRMRVASRFLRHGEGQQLWPSFVVRLEGSQAVQDAPDEAVKGAETVFALFDAAARSVAQADGVLTHV